LIITIAVWVFGKGVQIIGCVYSPDKWLATKFTFWIEDILAGALFA